MTTDQKVWGLNPYERTSKFYEIRPEKGLFHFSTQYILILFKIYFI